MANKFLNSSSENANLSNGTVEIFGSSLGASNLSGSQCVKTNAMRQLISSDINISDVIGLQSYLIIRRPCLRSRQFPKLARPHCYRSCPCRTPDRPCPCTSRKR